MIKERQTKYINAIRNYMEEAHHATNLEILNYLRRQYPDLSSTTVHRITKRMLERGDLIIAPANNENVTRLDSRLDPHDHFACQLCDQLRDIVLPLDMINQLQALIDDCQISGRLTIQGSCSKCIKYKEI